MFKLRFLLSIVTSLCQNCLIHFQESMQLKSTVIKNMDFCLLNQPVNGM